MILFWVKEVVPHREVSARQPRKALCSCSTDPLVPSAALILVIADQRGFAMDWPLEGSLFPCNKLPILLLRQEYGVITPSGCPLKHCVLCVGFCVDFKAGDMEISSHCMCVCVCR